MPKKLLTLSELEKKKTKSLIINIILFLSFTKNLSIIYKSYKFQSIIIERKYPDNVTLISSLSQRYVFIRTLN
jgi:hypothetical protein